MIASKIGPFVAKEPAIRIIVVYVDLSSIVAYRHDSGNIGRLAYDAMTPADVQTENICRIGVRLSATLFAGEFLYLSNDGTFRKTTGILIQEITVEELVYVMLWLSVLHENSK